MKKIYFSFLFIVLLYSCDEIIEVEDISNSSVNILAPTNEATIATGTIHFNWQNVEYATEYQLQIATPNFENATSIIVDTTLTDNNFSSILEANEYEWRVRAINSNYQTEYTTNLLTIN